MSKKEKKKINKGKRFLVISLIWFILTGLMVLVGSSNLIENPNVMLMNVGYMVFIYFPLTGYFIYCLFTLKKIDFGVGSNWKKIEGNFEAYERKVILMVEENCNDIESSLIYLKKEIENISKDLKTFEIKKKTEIEILERISNEIALGRIELSFMKQEKKETE